MNDDKPICGAKIRNSDETCQSTEVYSNGRCAQHGGLSTGPKTSKGKLIASQNGVPKPEAALDAQEPPADEIEDTGNEFDRQQRELETILDKAKEVLDVVNKAIPSLEAFAESLSNEKLVAALITSSLSQDALQQVLEGDEALKLARAFVVKEACRDAVGKLKEHAETASGQIEMCQRALTNLPLARRRRMEEMLKEGANASAIVKATGLPLSDVIGALKFRTRDARVLEYARVAATSGSGYAMKWFEDTYGTSPPGAHEVQEVVTEAAHAGNQQARALLLKRGHRRVA